ncbi:hypothetical protein RMQ97_05405 [Maricaulis sp. D1M11]|uniref:hypothetical protein n=1 Tax=Maricaulis sp. D1M11 TaxID=3076117 RepID=UPI0039B5F696
MKTLSRTLALTALAGTSLTLLAPMAAQAQSQSYTTCEQQRTERQVAGALIGGIIGAVIGNEIADDSNNDRYPDYRDHRRYDRHGRYERRGRYDRHHRRHHRHDSYYHRDRGNAEEVGTIAGAGVGALIGAGIAGGEDCDPYANSRYQQQGYYDQGGYDQGYNQAGYDPRYAGYDDGYSSGQVYSEPSLAGGPQNEARVYQAGSQSANYSTGRCQWTATQTANAYGQPTSTQVYMCQGTDGIWRPADTY